MPKRKGRDKLKNQDINRRKKLVDNTHTFYERKLVIARSWDNEQKITTWRQPLILFYDPLSLRYDTLDCLYVFAHIELVRWYEQKWSVFRQKYGFVLIEGRCCYRGNENKKETSKVLKDIPIKNYKTIYNNCQFKLKVEESKEEKWLRIGCIGHKGFSLDINYSELLKEQYSEKEIKQSEKKIHDILLDKLI